LNEAWLLWGLLFGSFGLGYFVYGKKQKAVVPLVCGTDSFLLNKAGIIWAQVAGDAAGEIVAVVGTGRKVPVRLSLTGGVNLLGTLIVVMPAERSRVLDYLNAADRFLPLFGDGSVTLVQRRFVVTVRTAEEAEPAGGPTASVIQMRRSP